MAKFLRKPTSWIKIQPSRYPHENCGQTANCTTPTLSKVPGMPRNYLSSSLCRVYSPTDFRFLITQQIEKWVDVSPDGCQPLLMPCPLPGLGPGSRKHLQYRLTLLPPGSRWVYLIKAIQPFLRKAYRHQRSSEADRHSHEQRAVHQVGKSSVGIQPAV